MRLPTLSRRLRRRGSLLTVMVIAVGVCTLIAGLTVSIGVTNVRLESRRLHRLQARYAAEAALQQAMFNVAYDDTFGNSVSSPVVWSDADGQMPNFPQAQDASSHYPSIDVNVVVENASSGVARNYQIAATATASGVSQTVSAIIRKNPPSQVFDYEYFLNNWGWWWGNGITGNGNQRTNGRFDFRQRPTVNGHVHASLGIYHDGNEWYPGQTLGTRGLASDEPDTYLHPYGERLEMPNLSDLSTYKALSQEKEGSLTYYRNIDESLHQGVQPEKVTITFSEGGADSIPGSIYLKGTTDYPITVDGPVVIEGNLAITGTITGKGTIYTGRNTYVMGSLEYLNGPAFNLSSSDLSDQNDWQAKDAWVSDNQDRDLVAIASRESILFGNMDNYGQWKDPWQDSSYGIRDRGDEHVGPDGIPDTADDNEAFDRDGDGVVDSNWFDVDGDGVEDGNYVWSDVAPGLDSNGNYPTSAYTAGDCSHYTNWPTDHQGRPLAYTRVVDNAHSFDAIFYTNHAFAGRLHGQVEVNGAFISKDEAVVGFSKITVNYDWRVHSRYNDDPSRLIDLGLPITNAVSLLAWRDGRF